MMSEERKHNPWSPCWREHLQNTSLIVKEMFVENAFNRLKRPQIYSPIEQVEILEEVVASLRNNLEQNIAPYNNNKQRMNDE